MQEHWSSEEELEEMARPTMDRAIEAIEAGDLERAKALCEAMKHEWRFLHDLMVDGIAASLTWVKEHCGEDGVGGSQRWAMERYWKRSVEAIDKRDRKDLVELLAAIGGRTRARYGPAAGGLHDRRGRRKADLPDESVRVRAAAVADGPLRGDDGHALIEEEHDWSYNRKGPSIYAQCTFMNEVAPDPLDRLPRLPERPAWRLRSRSCTWYWYKDPADIPDRHWQRYGLERG